MKVVGQRGKYKARWSLGSADFTYYASPQFLHSTLFLASSLFSALVFCLHLFRPVLLAPEPPMLNLYPWVYRFQKQIYSPEHTRFNISHPFHSPTWHGLSLSFPYFTCWAPVHPHFAHPVSWVPSLLTVNECIWALPFKFLQIFQISWNNYSFAMENFSLPLII